MVTRIFLNFCIQNLFFGKLFYNQNSCTQIATQIRVGGYMIEVHWSSRPLSRKQFIKGASRDLVGP